ncbi:MAG: DUF4349 domain-containing protein [Lachnospiraceae bacterium]|nr:DUF4349 domain-containing protein [Lachnospiraceae bacterium]
MKKMKMFRKLMIGAAIGCLLLTGCGSSASDSSYSGNSYVMPVASTQAMDEYKGDYDYGYYEDYAAEAEMALSENPAYSAADASRPQTVDTSRKLITTANVDIETKEFDRLFQDVEDYVKANGGYLESINTYNGSRYHGDIVERHANLTVRIPAEKLDAFMEEIGNAGNITSRTQNVEDITLTYVDLEAHKRTLKEEEERLNEFLRNAETIEDMIYIEDRLSNIRYQLESMESQLRTYDNKINYSTVYLNINEVVEYSPVVYEEPSVGQRMKEGFLDTVDDIKEWFQDFAVWFVSNIIYLVIWGLVIFALVKWILYMASDKRAARKAAKLAKKQKAQYEAYQQSMEKLSSVQSVTGDQGPDVNDGNKESK